MAEILAWALVPASICILVWASLALFGISPGRGGITPRDTGSFGALLWWPMVHADFAHLRANLLPLMLLSLANAWVVARRMPWLLLLLAVLPGLLVWLLARPGSHMGASVWIFGLLGHLFGLGLWTLARVILPAPRERSGGLFSRLWKVLSDVGTWRMVIAVVLADRLYGGILHSVLPTDPKISWEAHLAGMLCGLGIALGMGFRQHRRGPQ